MIKKHKKTKKGAAAYYIVAFSTLILVVIATSFAMVMLSEMSRSSNDELSQSAYDAALTGIEDAKLAFASYRRCVESGATKSGASGTAVNCKNIIKWVEEGKCDSVAKVLGRTITNGTEVDIGGIDIGTGTNRDTSTNQAYTCAIIHANLNDYRSTLSADKTKQTMRAEIGNGATNDVNKIKISWHSVRTDAKISTKNFAGSKVTFKQRGSDAISVPPTLEVQIVQTGPTFKMADFDKVTGTTRTNRATLYLVPTTNLAKAKINNSSTSNHTTNSTNYIGAAIDDTTNRIARADVVKTNDHTASNKPFLVYCNKDTTDEFYCSVEIEIPNVIDGSGYSRNNKTFMISISEPYQTPDTDFAIEFFCATAGTCGGTEDVKVSGRQVKIKNTQVAIDVTGRANDLYRRIETRLESSDTTFASGFPDYVLEILGSSGASKKMKVQSEYDFDF